MRQVQQVLIKKNNFRLHQMLCTVIILSLICNFTALAQSSRSKNPQVQQINASVDNGIFVDTTKVYDDSSLQLMLNAARLRLASLQSFDQNGLLSRIGALSGATLQQQAFSAQILGPPLPQTVETSLGATGATQTVTNPAGQATTTVNAGLPVQNVTTTTPQMTASAPAPPANSASLPTTGFNVSSLDALNEMMQLTYEIANLQLLLEGSLSDRYVKGERIIKPRTTLGFPITITTQERYKDAVAIVEIEVINPAKSNTFSNEPPTVTALLPREKTYNIASITDRMTSVGGGIVTQVINGGFSFLRGRKSYYIVQDQDTLALMQRGSTDPAQPSTAFSWQFRPVLGQSYVRSGLRQTFVQLAAPVKASSGCFGNIRVKTYWRKYDRKRGVLKEVIADSIRVDNVYQPIPVFDLTPVVEDVEVKDLGSGIVQATIEGKFLNGTYVRVGNNFYREGSPGFTSEIKQIRFVAPAAEVAKYRAYLVSRDGTETEIVTAQAPINLPKLNPTCGEPTTQPQQPVSINASIEVAAYDNSNSVLTAKFSAPLPKIAPSLNEYNIVLGGKVFGLSDAPIERAIEQQKITLKAIVPTNLLLSSTVVEIKPLLWRADYSVIKPAGFFKAENSADKIVAYKQSAGGNTMFLLYGNRLNSAKILVPSGVQLTQFEDYADTDTLRSFELTPDQIKGKQIIVQKSQGERPIMIPLPSSGADADKKPTLTVKGRIIVGADEVTVSGDSLDKLKSVAFKGNKINFNLSKDKKTVALIQLVSARVTTEPTEQELEFEFEGGVKSILKLDIVNSKIEMIQRISN